MSEVPIGAEPAEDSEDGAETSAELPREGTTEGYEDFAHTPRPSGEAFVERPLEEFREAYRGEYLEPRGTSTPVEPFDAPQSIADRVNPHQYDGSAWNTNCADCSRAVERTWRGSEEFAAGRNSPLDASPVGEDYDRMEDWSGQELHRVHNPDDIPARLLEAGHGSSAVVETQYRSAFDERHTGGHAFNVVNHEGRVVVVDGQVGRTYDWKAGTGHPAMAETSDMRVVGWDGTGRPLWRD